MKKRNLTHRLMRIAIGALAPILASAQNTAVPPKRLPTPFHIVNSLSGLCVQYRQIPNLVTYRIATCSDSNVKQAFYLFHANEDKPFQPQADGPIPLRILRTVDYLNTPTQWINVRADSGGLGLPIFSYPSSSVQFPPPSDHASWIFVQTGSVQTAAGLQFQGMLLNTFTGACMRPRGGPSAPLGNPAAERGSENSDAGQSSAPPGNPAATQSAEDPVAASEGLVTYPCASVQEGVWQLVPTAYQN